MNFKEKGENNNVKLFILLKSNTCNRSFLFPSYTVNRPEKGRLFM